MIRQTFFRYEFKYLINNKLSEELISQSLNFMKKDNYALSSNQGYFVRSLYYDNSNYDNFFEKVDGMQTRKKFRIRTYSSEIKKNNIFLEMKGRQRDRIIKKRIMIKNEDLEIFENLKNIEKIIHKYNDNILIKEFIYEVYRKKIKPKILIDYNRLPLINKHGLYFRLTFDSNILTSKSQNLFRDKNFYFPIKYGPGKTILEVKFDRCIPAWFHRMIQSYNLNRKSISKFVLGICNCNIKNETSD